MQLVQLKKKTTELPFDLKEEFCRAFLNFEAFLCNLNEIADILRTSRSIFLHFKWSVFEPGVYDHKNPKMK